MKRTAIVIRFGMDSRGDGETSNEFDWSSVGVVFQACLPKVKIKRYSGWMHWWE